MLDADLMEQLRSVFARLERKVLLTHEGPREAGSGPLFQDAQQEMTVLLQSLVSTSDHLGLSEKQGAFVAPRVGIAREGEEPRVFFRGAPNGHEFSSLVLAILHADSKGKLPDDSLIARIRSLKGGKGLRTYMSLTCENCPEVVQALNLVSFLNPRLSHEVVDGALAQDEVEALGIQGVPAVFVGDTLIHSGKATLTDLLAALETHLGREEGAAAAQDLGDFDVAVIGGGPAGASAAIYSARKGLKTALIADRIGGQLKDTQGIENMISVPYTEGVRLAAQLSEHMSRYPIQILEHRRVRAIHGDKTQTVELERGESLRATSVIVATGAQWRELGIPGEKEHIGRGVAFCAHCDGPFYRGKRVAVVGGGNSGVEAAIDLAGLATHVTLLEYGEKLKADDVLVQKLQSLPNVRVITQARSQRVVGSDGKVIGLEFVHRTSEQTETVEVDGVFVQIGLQPNSQFLKGVVDLTPYGEVVVDTKGRTSKPGIYAAGDVTTIPFKQIVTAMGDGAKVALAAFEDRLHAKPSV